MSKTIKKIKDSKKKATLSVLAENMNNVVQNLYNNKNVLEIKYEPEYSYTLCRGKVSRETIGYKVKIVYTE